MPCGAKRLGIDCGSYGITTASLHAMRASIEFARARVLQASQRMTAVTPFAKREVLWCRNAVPSCECGATPWPGGPKCGGTLSGSARPGARRGLGGGPDGHRVSRWFSTRGVADARRIEAPRRHSVLSAEDR